MKQKNDFENLTPKKHIEISDLSLVSVLAGCLGFSILEIKADPNEYPKVKFVFERSEKLEETITKFWNGSLLVEPKNYWSAIRELKSRIHS
ncbi:hypothetical protein A3F29_03895 [Candidatus Roizmanbacteria bacterium RIFCSPHIGHO2_12_FULL_33_9]|uniref:DUF5659 domain-containing protein n=1 Tax=Candidatus Roizmanbacteria bacterium RIFCSPHIGHO2_12_FULL_33_9 TaxID=1802045 RepID=A0A1F7HJ64_9BACT|nr:MAG: hypothetical protein A3F29_03895 [Candidatus Roizmanbacteria bacterium RIFCSPHIGHO2_12_FULL_33_9]